MWSSSAAAFTAPGCCKPRRRPATAPCSSSGTALASGTSSRSSKLIHGGLRYLESGQFALVRESLRERAIHLRIAAELVELKPFFIPVYRDTRRRPWQLKIGLWMYALLGGFDAGTRFGTRARGASGRARRARDRAISMP